MEKGEDRLCRAEPQEAAVCTHGEAGPILRSILRANVGTDTQEDPKDRGGALILRSTPGAEAEQTLRSILRAEAGPILRSIPGAEAAADTQEYPEG